MLNQSLILNLFWTVSLFKWHPLNITIKPEGSYLTKSSDIGRINPIDRWILGLSLVKRRLILKMILWNVEFACFKLALFKLNSFYWIPLSLYARQQLINYLYANILRFKVLGVGTCVFQDPSATIFVQL